MPGMEKRYLLAWVAALAFAAPALAQMQHYPVKTMNFDLWCQEEANLPPDRCDKRLPSDEKTFEAYRTKIERYEIPYLQEKENEAQFNRTVLHNDPIDNPVDKNEAAQDQQPTQPDGQTPP